MNIFHTFTRTLLLMAVLTSTARADILVLVHGWSANADSWIHSGVMQSLQANGWSDAGLVLSTPAGIQHRPAPTKAMANKVYRVHLPAEAPMQLQAAHLFAQLQYIRQQNPTEPLSIAGHSAGGVVARLVVIRPAALNVKSLITIATPNLGTGRAIQGLNIADSKPFFCPGPGIDFLKEMVGGNSYRYLKHSRGALVGLTPAVPGSLIGWLNQQPHPDISYHAVVRNNGAGDELVPGFSQDLNQVPALRGKAKVYMTPAAHSLNPADGALLAQILAGK